MNGGRTRGWAGTLPLAAVLVLSACATTTEEKHVVKEPVTVVVDAATGLGRLTLTPKAAERIGLTTVVVEEVDGRRVIPSGAVIVDAEGKRYVYANPEGRVFSREPITVADENDGRAWLADGPPAGTRVVTIGAAELHGAETGIK